MELWKSVWWHATAWYFPQTSPAHKYSSAQANVIGSSLCADQAQQKNIAESLHSSVLSIALKFYLLEMLLVLHFLVKVPLLNPLHTMKAWAEEFYAADADPQNPRHVTMMRPMTSSQTWPLASCPFATTMPAWLKSRDWVPSCSCTT